MNRTTEQRVGDIALVLAGVAAMLYVGVFWNALDIADGIGKLFWSYLGYSVSQSLYLVFAAACMFNWMDDARKRSASYAVIGVLALCALTTVAATVLGRVDIGGRSEVATYVLEGTWLVMAVAGIAIVKGFVPRQLSALVDDATDVEDAE